MEQRRSFKPTGLAKPDPAAVKGLLETFYDLRETREEKDIAEAVWRVVREASTYTIPFKTKRGIVEVDGISAEASFHLYRICLALGWAPSLKVKHVFYDESPLAITCTALWEVCEPTGAVHEYFTVGTVEIRPEQRPMNPRASAASKAERNMQLKVIPFRVRDFFKQYLRAKTGRPVAEHEEEAERMAVVPIHEEPGAPPAAGPPGGLFK